MRMSLPWLRNVTCLVRIDVLDKDSGPGFNVDFHGMKV